VTPLTSEDWIRSLRLAPHPEGGFFRECYRAPGTIPRDALPADFSGPRSYFTVIYFLLRAGEFSSFHRIRSDESWHFHQGAPLTIHELRSDGTLAHRTLGVAVGAEPVLVVPAGSWFGASLTGTFDRGESGNPPYSLVSCGVAPGFDFEDFELATRQDLRSRFPEHRTWIERLTR
jgi:predicted cupin superfamily sugar epimerase